MKRLALIAALIVLATSPAYAAKPTPNSSCAGYPTGSFTTSAGQETGGLLYFLVCDGSVWQPVEQFSHPNTNIGIGYGVLFSSGNSNNVAIGDNALHSNTGNSSVAIGSSADYFLATGGHEVAIGTQALYNSTYGYNIGIGYGALSSVGQGNNAYGNIGIGVNIGQTLISGLNNILIGGNVGGSPLDVPASNTSNFLNIGNTIFATGVNTGSLAAPAGNVGIDTNAPAAPLHVNGEAIVGMKALACASGTAGAIRYNSGTQAVEFCNGTIWQRVGAYTGGTPTISSCGAGSSVTGTDVSFLLITASGGLGTGVNKCVVNFGSTWATAPTCVITPSNIHASDDISGWYISTSSTTQFGLGLTPASGGSTGGDAFYVQCQK